MTKAFVHKALPAHVVFGRGTLGQVPQLLAELGKRALLVSTPDQAEEARTRLSGAEAIVAHFEGAVMHTPTDVTERALQVLHASGADCLVAFGGGSTIGLAKALALRTGLPQLAIPTTYAGSEMTPILGQTEDGRKTTLRADAVLPRTVLYDVDLTLGLPAGLSGTSGINAMAHAVEGLYSQNVSPVMALIAERGVELLAGALPRIASDPANVDARSEALEGAWLCGTVLGSAGMALHHKLCHTLGGSLGLPHAETHAVVLPHALAYNAPFIQEAYRRLGAVLGGDPAQRIFDLGRQVQAPASLRELGMAGADIEDAAAQAVENPYWNPRPIEPGEIRGLIARAWAGDRPVS